MCKIFLNLEPYKNTGLCTMITNNMELWIWDAQNTHLNEIQMFWANFWEGGIPPCVEKL